MSILTVNKDELHIGKLDYDCIIDSSDIMNLATEGFVFEQSKDRQKKINEWLTTKMQELPHEFTPINEDKSEFKLGPLLLSELGKEVEEKSNLCIAVTGFFNKGKTFFLNNLAQIDLAANLSVHTRGLSFLRSKHIMLLDTAGTNVPVEQADIKACVPIVEKEFPLIPKLEGSDARDHSKKKEYDEKVTDRESKLWERATEIATIKKKNLESFFQNLIFNVANVIIVVVNEMTFFDQIHIKAMTMFMEESKLQAAAASMNNKETVDAVKHSKMFVIHNYKTISSDEIFAKLKKQYVYDCFYGQELARKISMPNSAQTVEIRVFQNHNANVEHLFLGQKDSEAGFHNAATFQYLRDTLQTLSFQQQSTTIVERMCHQIQQLMLQSFKKVNPVFMTWNKEQLKFKTDNELKLKNTKIRLDGFDIHCNLTTSIDVKYDAIITTNAKEKIKYLNIVADMPGVVLKPSNYLSEPNDNYVTFHVTKDNKLIIRGQRVLQLLDPSAASGNDLSKCPASMYCNDSGPVNVSDDNLIEIQRTRSTFAKEIPIPIDFTPIVHMNTLVNGVLQVVFKEKPVEEDDGAF